MSLSKIIKGVIEEQVSSVSSLEPAVRLLLEGIPEDELRQVIALIAIEPMSSANGSIVPFLVVSDSSEKLWDNATCESGEYKQGQITRARNVPDQSYVLAVPEQMGALGTLGGPAEIRPPTLPLVEDKVFAYLFPSDNGLARDLRKAMNNVLAARFSSKDIPDFSRWELLAKLGRLSAGSSPKDALLAIIGLPACPTASLVGKKRRSARFADVKEG